MNDTVPLVLLADIPTPEFGTPLPIVVANERMLVVAYRTFHPPPALSSTLRTAIVRFHWPMAHSFGYPNDEALDGHPLAPYGLVSYRAFTVTNSPWLISLEKANRVHPHHTPTYFHPWTHYVITFKDSTLECLAKRVDFTTAVISAESALQEMIGAAFAASAV